MTLLIPDDELRLKKARDKVPLQCERCGNIFHALKQRVQVARKPGSRMKLAYCSVKCGCEANKKAAKVACPTCGKPFERQASQMAKTDRSFCSRSCAAVFNNREGLLGTRRSGPELYLAQLLAERHPSLAIEFNVRNFLHCGFEIDALIREKRLAIEVNGPVHYLPIHGDGLLARVRRADEAKEAELRSLGFDFVTIDVSACRRAAQYEKVVRLAYEERISLSLA